MGDGTDMEIDIFPMQETESITSCGKSEPLFYYFCQDLGKPQYGQNILELRLRLPYLTPEIVTDSVNSLALFLAES